MTECVLLCFVDPKTDGVRIESITKDPASLCRTGSRFRVWLCSMAALRGALAHPCSRANLHHLYLLLSG